MASRPGAMLKLEMLEPERVDWRRLDAFEDRVVFQTREWMAFVAETQDAQPVIAEVRDGATPVGYFTGLVVRRFGMRILGSPFPGWTTSYMGFNLERGVPRKQAVEALVRFAFEKLRCVHIELRDRRIELADVAGLPIEHTPWPGYEVDLSPSEDEIWRRFQGSARTSIRKAERVGVVVEEANDLAFADDLYAQLTDVFAKQSLVPTYDVERVRAMIRHMLPTGRLLLLRARNAEGVCIATGIFPAMNGAAYFMAGASWRQYQILQPNEAIMWHAMRYWKARDVECFDLGGGLRYKQKYSPSEYSIPFLRKSRFRALMHMRNAAREAFALRQRAAGQLRRLRSVQF
jgi:CelD/BcsL family acetyltransferase involved in cellulose biosynthesis